MGPQGGLKQRGNKLHNFVIGDGADEEYQTALVTQDDNASQGNNIPSHEGPKSSRQEVADHVRLAMPQPRHTARHLRERSLAGHQNPRSPIRSRHASPRPAPSLTESSDHFNGLFAPSILGDDFMRSEASTPLPVELEQDENIAPRRRPDVQTRKPPPPPRWSTGLHDLAEETAKFVTNDDGFMQVVKSGKKYTPTALRDGFTKNDYYEREQQRTSKHQEDRELPLTTVEHHTGLPIRTEPRRLTKAKEDRVLYSARAASPSHESEQWTPGRQYEVRRSPQRHTETALQPPSEVSEHETRATARARRHATATYDGTVHAEEPTQYSSRQGSRVRKRHRENPDYDDQVLSSMSYKDLRNEAFDYDPSKAALAGVSTDGAHDLPTKLEQRRHRSEDEQRQFFASMPMEEWEESGDWFVDQFAALMKKMRDARREKRRVIKEFEEEAERREEVVRTRSETIDRKLGRMRQDGLKVVSDVSS